MNARPGFSHLGLALIVLLVARHAGPSLRGVRESAPPSQEKGSDFHQNGDAVKREILQMGDAALDQRAPSAPDSCVTDLPKGEKSSAGRGSAPPSAADEDALLSLLEDAKREEDPRRRRDHFVGVCLRWAAFDPPGAIRLALELGLDPLGGALLPNLAQQWAARDLDGVQAWARLLPAGELRDEVYSRIIYESGLRDPAAAAKLLGEMRRYGAARAEAASTILHLWAKQDIDAARAWFASAGLMADR